MTFSGMAKQKGVSGLYGMAVGQSYFESRWYNTKHFL